ncbi:MAG: carboxypeptidase regulatory-like domain-containing protein, partial [Planctomycetes bacterium]|nr:carboxypeptidase regulatory-like domain-containing protein [Planctomycetota bacterium]
RGMPVLSRAVVALAAAAPITAPDEGLRLPPGLGQQRVDKPPGDAPVVLPWHQVGVPIQLTARWPNVRKHQMLGPLSPPGEPGQVVDVTVALGPEHVVVAGRLAIGGADPQQLQPVRDTPINTALWRVDRDLFETTVDPVGDGSFDLVLPPRTDAEQFVLELRLPLPAAPAGVAAPSCLGARVNLPALRGGQRIELGTVVLGELPALVAGLVVDDEGNPVENADVQVQWEVTGEGRNERDPWRPMAMLRTRSGADGRFRIDGPLPNGKLRVRADTDQHFAASLPLWQQGQEVRIQIDRNGVLRGRVLLPDSLADGALSLQLRPVDESLRRSETRATDLSRRRGGRFTLEPLRPGRYDALVLLRNVAEPVAVLGDVWIRPGETR